MSLLNLLSFLMIILNSGVRAVNPAPVGPGFTLERGGVRFQAEGWHFLLEPMTMKEFLDYAEGLGVSKSLLTDEGVGRQLAAMVFFRIEIENSGADNLLFNPDHLLLRAATGPDGIQVDMANFWPSGSTSGRTEQERFARVFNRGTVEILPGKKHTHLAVFSPIRKRFKKKVLLQINRVYHGIQAYNLECGFEIRYPK